MGSQQQVQSRVLPEPKPNLSINRIRNLLTVRHEQRTRVESNGKTYHTLYYCTQCENSYRLATLRSYGNRLDEATICFAFFVIPAMPRARVTSSQSAWWVREDYVHACVREEMSFL
jgi:hypothetical protein